MLSVMHLTVQISMIVGIGLVVLFFMWPRGDSATRTKVAGESAGVGIGNGDGHNYGHSPTGGHSSGDGGGHDGGGH